MIPTEAKVALEIETQFPIHSFVELNANILTIAPQGSCGDEISKQNF
jgi:hypothetical protein